MTGDLATSWELSDDGVSFVFKIIENGTWMGGEKVTADDVVFSLDRMVETDKGPKPRVQESATFHESSAALDSYSVQLNMKFPAPRLLPLLGVDVFKILPKHWAAAKSRPPSETPLAPPTWASSSMTWRPSTRAYRAKGLSLSGHQPVVRPDRTLYARKFCYLHDPDGNWLEFLEGSPELRYY